MSKHQKTEISTIAERKKITDQLANDARCIELCKMRQNAANVSLYRRMHLESEEEEMFTNIQKAKEAQARQIAELEQEQKLAQVMADLKRREIVEIKTNQLLQNNSQELRHVEKQLRTAYAKKDLMCQIKEKEALKKEEKVRVYYDDLRLIESRNDENKEEIEQHTRQNELKLDYKNAITEQIQENINEKQRVSLQKNNPFVIFEATGSSAVQKNNVKTNCFQRDLELFTKIKNDLKEIERKESDNTNKRIEEYVMEIDKRNKQQEEFKNQKKVENDRIYKCLVDNLASLTSHTSKNNEIQNKLIYEEQRSAAWLAEKKEKDLKILQRENMLKQNEIQLNIKKDKEKAEKEKDYDLVKTLLQNFQVFNEVEEKKNAERRQKMINYGKELKMTIDQKTDLKQRQKKIAMNEFLEAVKSEELRMAEMKKEQATTVKQHMENLVGFFPPTARDQYNMK
ncbi:meiosis-specific nuclear structural protein 1-like [Acyrthosiphon pisum]|uniref:Meiosis-specific nuclear structural protein 1 n=1 Tax=Acyrthosiphon pisum TaxID=7029 RepID=A0A8R2B7C6_ACYPI|nr:meiosis-specific nuclear structural protein 1-like [Acyrthosiphon pisum]XP_008185336.1 meiosis-specific nuclear structural protein 1-like [Acyrthosiphon pisum]|eukprot:XP_001944194.2 PREDICTED: meiosis-specific nuclear structural protein 1-like [Acyrthosiphon pisum]